MFEVRQSTANTIRIVPYDGTVWSGPTCALLKPDGSTLATITPTVDAVSTTIASATDASNFVVASATGITVGRRYLVGLDGYTSVVEVAEVEGTTIRLVDGLPETPANSDTFVGIELSVALTAVHTATRGTNYRLVLTSSADATKEHVEALHIVRHPFRSPFMSMDVMRLVQQQWPSEVTTARFRARDAQIVSEQIAERLRNRLLHLDVYPHAIVDPSAFAEAARHVCKWILLDDYNLTSPGSDKDAYADRVETDMNASIGRAVRSLTPIDDDDDDDTADDVPDGGTPMVRWLR